MKPQEIKPGQFEVKFEFEGEKVNLVRPGKCFQVVVDFVALEELESEQQETKKKGNHFQGNKEHAIFSLGLQIQTLPTFWARFNSL